MVKQFFAGAVSVVAGLWLFASLASATVTVDILYPADGQVIQPGTILSVQIQAQATPESLKNISITMQNLGGAAWSCSEFSPVYSRVVYRDFNIPADIAAGTRYTITASANGYSTISTTVRTIHVTMAAVTDTTAPTYSSNAGVQFAQRFWDWNTGRVMWYEATDQYTSWQNMTYEIYYATDQTKVFSSGVKKTVKGVLETMITDLDANLDYYIGVRAVDKFGNREMNTNTFFLRDFPNAARDWQLYH